MSRIIVCTATEIEAKILMNARWIVRDRFDLLVTGIGPVNAAIGLTRRLSVGTADCVISLGIGGAYPNSGLQIGEVVCAETELYGDLGAASEQGFLDMKSIGFPVVGVHFNELPLDVFPVARKAAFVTRSTCTGTASQAQALEKRTGGAVESMEGAAIVHTAIAHGVPVGEIRGISNSVGSRDRSTWRVREAADAAAECFLKWLESHPC